MMYPILIRPWQADDAEVLRPMIYDMLVTTAQAGAELQATPKNVDALLRLGMQWSAAGEPTFVAGNPTVCGFTLWGSMGNPLGLDVRDRACWALGTYVLPVMRRLGVALFVREAAQNHARAQGYNRISGSAYDNVGLASAVAAGFKCVGLLVEATL